MQRSQADGLAGVGIGYVRDENGKLVKKKAAQSDDIYVTENGQLVPYVPPGPRRWTQEAQERCDRARAQRHTRSWFDKQLLDIWEGRLKVTREQYQALITFGRRRGWNGKRPSVER